MCRASRGRGMLRRVPRAEWSLRSEPRAELCFPMGGSCMKMKVSISNMGKFSFLDFSGILKPNSLFAMLCILIFQQFRNLPDILNMDLRFLIFSPNTEISINFRKSENPRIRKSENPMKPWSPAAVEPCSGGALQSIVKWAILA